MPTPINTKRARGEGRVGPGAPTTVQPCGRFFGCGMRLLPEDREPGWALLPLAQGLVAGKMQESREPSGMISGSQRGFRQNPSGAPGAQMPVLCPHGSCPHLLVPPETVHSDGPPVPLPHDCPPCGMASRSSLSCRPYLCMPCVWVCASLWDLPNPCPLA